MKKLTLLALSTLISTNASANGDANVVYSCTTTENKPLLVKKEGANYVFSYGNVTFKNAIKDALKNAGSEIAGGSQFTTISLELQHNGNSYIVGHIEPGDIESGLSVKNTKTGADVGYFECNPAKPIKHKFDRKQMSKSGFAA